MSAHHVGVSDRLRGIRFAQGFMSVCRRMIATVPSGAPAAAARRAHQLRERRRGVLDLGLAEHPVDDIAFDCQRLEFVQALRPSRSASGRRRRAARRSARLPAPAPSPARASPAARAGARPRRVPGPARRGPRHWRGTCPASSLMSSGFIPCCCSSAAIRCAMFCASASTSERGTANSRLLPQRARAPAP